MQRLDKKKKRKTAATADSTTPASSQQTGWQGGYENIDTQGHSPELPAEVWDAINEELAPLAKMQFAQVSRGTYALGYVSNNGNGLYNNFYKKPFHNGFIRAVREQEQTFLLHVVRGEKKEAEEMIMANPSLLLANGRVKDFAGRTIEGSALGMALGAEDVAYGDSKCDIVMIPPPEDLENLTPDYIRNLVETKKAAYIRCDDKLFYSDKVNDEYVEITLDQAVLNLFDAEFKPQNKARALSKEEIKQMTSLTGHDHHEEMAEMIQRHLRTQFDNGEAIIAAQIAEQFPEGWEEKEKERAEQDLKALNDVVDAIAQSQKDADCDEALNKFRKYLQPEDSIRTGKHFNIQLLLEVFKLYDKKLNDFGGYDSRKNKLFWQKVIGAIQRYLPACHAQILCQGAYYIVTGGEKLKRSFKFRIDDVIFFPLDTDPDFRLGYEYAASEGSGRSMRSHGTVLLNSEIDLISYVEQKTSTVQSIVLSSDNNAKSQYTMM